MATPKSQRIIILIIAIVMIVGTLGSFLVMGLSLNNQKLDEAAQQEAYNKYLEQQQEAFRLNAENSVAIDGYSTRTFDAASVTKLAIELLTVGNGQIIQSTDTVNASYFGWLSDGVIFDSSQKKSTADEPTSFSLAEVITGWTEGLTGLRVGSVVRLTIPADKAYGSQSSGIIPANSPLEFIVIIHSIGE
jgi:FKBP-type peptidyl-prolyl cis-trans isomerase